MEYFTTAGGQPIIRLSSFNTDDKNTGNINEEKPENYTPDISSLIRTLESIRKYPRI